MSGRSGGLSPVRPLIRLYSGGMAKKRIELVTKQIAAERLQLSVRRLMELSIVGGITRHRAVDPETKREAVMFDAAEVERLRAEYQAVPAPGGALAVRPRLMIEAPAGDPARDAPASTGDGRLWLKLAEAVAYSGLPASSLLEMIETGELKGRDVGVRPGGRWRIRRLALDAIE